jgi:phosphoglycolate phosphatase
VALLLLRGEPIGEVEAVLFDKDGTLSISEPMLHALAKARVFQCDRLVAEHADGLGPSARAELRGLLERAYGLHPETINPAGTTAAATDNLHGQGSRHRPMATAGLHALVEQLARASVRCAVISNDEVGGIEAFLGSQAIRHHFQALWSAEHTPRKPDPAAVHALCDELGVEPARCALIGDANSDLLMARQAGVGVVLGYVAGWRTPPPLDPSFPRLGHWADLEARCSRIVQPDDGKRRITT